MAALESDLLMHVHVNLPGVLMYRMEHWKLRMLEQDYQSEVEDEG